MRWGKFSSCGGFRKHQFLPLLWFLMNMKGGVPDSCCRRRKQKVISLLRYIWFGSENTTFVALIWASKTLSAKFILAFRRCSLQCIYGAHQPCPSQVRQGCHQKCVAFRDPCRTYGGPPVSATRVPECDTFLVAPLTHLSEAALVSPIYALQKTISVCQDGCRSERF